GGGEPGASERGGPLPLPGRGGGPGRRGHLGWGHDLGGRADQADARAGQRARRKGHPPGDGAERGRRAKLRRPPPRLSRRPPRRLIARRSAGVPLMRGRLVARRSAGVPRMRGATPGCPCVRQPHRRWRAAPHLSAREEVSSTAMPGIRVKEGESIESALKRFKKATEKAGILSEIRKREHYEKPSVKRKKKALAAKKRAVKKQRKSF